MEWRRKNWLVRRRGGRVVEGDSLENCYIRKDIVGSNPTLSALLVSSPPSPSTSLWIRRIALGYKIKDFDREGRIPPPLPSVAEATFGGRSPLEGCEGDLRIYELHCLHSKMCRRKTVYWLHR